MTLGADTLLPNRIYNLTLFVENYATNHNGSHSTMLYTSTTPMLNVQIDSTSNKNGYINSNDSPLFVALARLNDTAVIVPNSTYSWTVTDHFGSYVSLSGSSISSNFLKLKSGILNKGEYYTIDVSVSYLNHTGSAKIEYQI